MIKLDQAEVDKQEVLAYESIPLYKEMRNLFPTSTKDILNDPGDYTEIIEWNRMVADIVEENNFILLAEWYRGWAEYWLALSKKDK